MAQLGLMLRFANPVQRICAGSSCRMPYVAKGLDARSLRRRWTGVENAATRASICGHLPG